MLKNFLKTYYRKLNYWKCNLNFWYKNGFFFQIDSLYPYSSTYTNTVETFYVIKDPTRKTHGLLKLYDTKWQLILDPHYDLINLKNNAYVFICNETDTIYIFFKKEYLILDYRLENNIAVFVNHKLVDYGEIPDVTNNFLIVVKSYTSNKESAYIFLDYKPPIKILEADKISLENLKKCEILTSEKLYDVSIYQDIVTLEKKKSFK